MVQKYRGRRVEIIREGVLMEGGIGHLRTWEVGNVGSIDLS